MSEIEVITKSRLAVYGQCQRLHDLQYIRGYRPAVESESMAWGSLLHAGLEAWWKAHQRGESLLALPDAEVAMVAYRAAHLAAIDDAAMARAEVLIVAYDARWAASMADYEVIGVEVEFVATIPGRKRLRVAGKLDALIRRRSDGVVMFVEHKTSGADLSLGSTYWARLRMDPQISIYFAGARELGHDPHACIYDVIVRPDLRPLKATPAELRKHTKPTKTEPSRLYANQREADETIEEFRGRMATALRLRRRLTSLAPRSFGWSRRLTTRSEMSRSWRCKFGPVPTPGLVQGIRTPAFCTGGPVRFCRPATEPRRSTTKRSSARRSASTKSCLFSTEITPTNPEREGIHHGNNTNESEAVGADQ